MVIIMKYPQLINTLVYKRLNGSTYRVLDCLTDNEYELGSEIVRFANMLDGKTDPYATDSSLSDEQITETLEWFKENGLTRTSKIQKRSFLTYNIDLFRIKPTATKRILARILNFALIILFVPALIGGIITAINMPNLADVDAIQQFIGLIIGGVIGTVFHEIAHALAALGYNAHVFSFGITIGLLPGAYVQEDDEFIKSALKKAQISFAGIEMNLFLCGISLIFMGIFQSAKSVFWGIGAINLLLGLSNILPLLSYVDGLHTVSYLVGGDFILYASELAFNKNFLKAASHRGIEGFAEIFVCFWVLISRISLPVFIIANIIYIRSVFLMKHISNLINIIILFTPCILMSVAAAKKSVVWGVISIIFVFLFVFLARIAKKKENFWMFVISTITLLPANIKIAVLAYSYISESKILSVSVAILLFFLLAGTEQILLGFITRAIKRNQSEIEIEEYF